MITPFEFRGLILLIVFGTFGWLIYSSVRGLLEGYGLNNVAILSVGVVGMLALLFFYKVRFPMIR